MPLSLRTASPAGTISGLYHEVAVELLGHLCVDGVGGSRREADITWHAEHLMMRDLLPAMQNAQHPQSVD